MDGLVAYDYDSPSDTEAGPSISGNSEKQNTNDKSLRSSGKTHIDGRRISKAQVIIKRPNVIHKNQLRTHTSDDILANERAQDNGFSTEGSTSVNPETRSAHGGSSEEPQDEMSRLRALLRPPPIPGIEDWGIHRETDEKCETALQTKFAKFSSLKLDTTKPTHFNDSLMSNRSFRNPHLYAQLVDWVDVDERTTNFPKDIWDPDDVRPDWYANQIADAQKERSEKQVVAQSAGKRSHIEFASSGSSKEKPHQGSLPSAARKSRFQPYGTSAISSSSATSRDRQRTRWG